MKIILIGILILWFIGAVLLLIGKYSAYRAYRKCLDDEPDDVPDEEQL